MDPVAHNDQRTAELTSVASTLGRYRRELLEEGFSPGEAYKLCADWHSHWLCGPFLAIDDADLD